ncbi:hypothetical protein CEXT_325941 [Caerostris extrusa]|uniref:Uncharacterized protein n=1 Tax=Caerostris extrusa TaxID=172846 RepID=A0AAV4SBU4_CAEEX|nr:hypothetical protein CEXT_325941 [Caerostris extrusa]
MSTADKKKKKVIYRPVFHFIKFSFCSLEIPCAAIGHRAYWVVIRVGTQSQSRKGLAIPLLLILLREDGCHDDNLIQQVLHLVFLFAVSVRALLNLIGNPIAPRYGLEEGGRLMRNNPFSPFFARKDHSFFAKMEMGKFAASKSSFTVMIQEVEACEWCLKN